MSSSDNTKDLLEQMLAQLYDEQSRDRSATGNSYLIAQDDQYLGKITDNAIDNESILNEYGPYGSPYSTTSIFNEYSSYGSEYGAYSLNNPYCSTPPKLYVNGRFLGNVSVNQYVSNRIPTEVFLYTLKNNLPALLKGTFIRSEIEVRKLKGESFIEAEDGTFLGKINPNKYDSDSIFNKYGPYGSKYSDKSIFNKYSNYGSQFSQLSPNNKFSTTPPKIYNRGQFVAYLTVNQTLRPSVYPDELLDWAENNVSKY